jgi:hypothetical protein
MSFKREVQWVIPIISSYWGHQCRRILSSRPEWATYGDPVSEKKSFFFFCPHTLLTFRQSIKLEIIVFKVLKELFHFLLVSRVFL